MAAALQRRGEHDHHQLKTFDQGLRPSSRLPAVLQDDRADHAAGYRCRHAQHRTDTGLSAIGARIRRKVLRPGDDHHLASREARQDRRRGLGGLSLRTALGHGPGREVGASEATELRELYEQTRFDLGRQANMVERGGNRPVRFVRVEAGQQPRQRHRELGDAFEFRFGTITRRQVQERHDSLYAFLSTLGQPRAPLHRLGLRPSGSQDDASGRLPVMI